jgi:hypothetical protein
VLTVRTLLSNLRLDMPDALMIWLGLVAFAALGAALLAASSRPPHRRASRSRGRRSATPTHLVTEAEDRLRYAQEVAVAAKRAARTAEQCQREWQATGNAKEAAWRAFDAADRAARRAIRAAAFPVPDSPLTAEEAASRERYLHRAATAAYHRGELGLEQLSAALLHRGGWDPHRHPGEQEVILRRLARTRLLETYQAVSEAERSAWQQADDAAEAWYRLSREALAAAIRAQAPPTRPAAPPRRTRVAAAAPRLALR